MYIESIPKEQLEQMFLHDDVCLEYLAKNKWENGFICKKCGNDNSCDGKVPFSKRCTRCKTEESATSNTLFHNLKFPVSKAFKITYEVLTHSKVSIYELSQQLNLRHVSCWNFRNKVEERIKRLEQRNDKPISITEILVENIESPFI